MLAVVYVLLSSMSFAMNQAGVRRGMLRGSALQGVYISIWIGVPVLIISAAVSTQLFRAGDLEPRSYLLLVAVGVNHFIIGRYCNHRAIGAVGANRNRTIVGANVPFSILLAVVLLGEEVTQWMWVGMALVLAGPAIVFRRQSSATPPRTSPQSVHAAVGESAEAPAAGAVQGAEPEAPPPRFVEGYAFGLLNAISFGISPLLVRSALGGSGLGVLGSLVAYSAASVVLVPLLALPMVRANLHRIDAVTSRWFMVSAVSVVLAQMFRYLALSVAPVTVVLPLMRAGSVLLLPVSYVFNRRIESFEPRVLVGIFISITGSLLVVL